MSRRGRLLAPTAVLALVLTAMLAGAGAAQAGNDPDPLGQVGQIVKGVTDALPQPGQQSSSPVPGLPTLPVPAAPSTPSMPSGTAPSQDDDSPGHETADPAEPDHASSHVLHGQVLPGQSAGGTPLTADAGSGTSTIGDDGSSSADATLLALGGMTLIGSQAGSAGSNDAHSPAEPVCSGSSGAVCPLQADSHATRSATASDSSTKTSAASICLTPPSALPIPLPTSTSPSPSCPGGLGLTALGSSSTMHRDLTTGRTQGATQSQAAGVCVPGAPGTGCVGVITSQGSADSAGTTSRSSSIADFFGASTPLSQPQGTPASLCQPPLPVTGLCAYVNQGETYLGAGLAGVSQTALDGNVLGLLSYDLGHSEVLVHQAGVPAVVSPPTTTTTVSSPVVAAPAVHHVKAVPAVEPGGVLPHTGGIWSGWLAIGLLTLAAGSALAARDLRRTRRAVR